MSYPKYPKTLKHDLKIGDQTMTVEIGKYSEQTAAAVLVTLGETVVHTTIALGNAVDWGYFPLHVEYIEKLYAGGIIKGSRWVKREGRPSDDAVLKARVIDRSIRPLFNQEIKNQVQVVNTVFSYDQKNDPDMAAIIGTAVALAVSEIPFKGPMAGLRIGYHQDKQQFVINPANGEREASDLDLVVSGTKDSIVMVESGANEVSEELILEAMAKAQEVINDVCGQIAEIAKTAGKPKVELVTELDPTEAEQLAAVTTKIAKDYQQQISQLVKQKAQLEATNLDDLVEQIAVDLGYKVDEAEAETEPVEFKLSDKRLGNLIFELMKKAARKMILEDGVRPDGRKPEDIRQIWCETDVFPRTHGSAMFKRGATQVVSVTTLGSPSQGQHIEDLEGEEVRHYLHHYFMPPYASGEAGRFGWPKRREVGHGALAERALLPMIPSQEEFAYTIRVVSEVLSSNGSTSQASVCGSTLSLMAAGVPIKRPVAGIAMGLMTDGQGKNVVLSDIQGLEDHVGDMDFKVAGTKEGVTALQMDIKVAGISVEILREALSKARKGRLHILGEMSKALAKPRESISPYAPKIVQLTIPVDKIGEVIGPGGKMIKSIIEQTGAEIDVDEDEERKLGVVNIASPDQDKIDQAAAMIEDITRTVEVGDEFEGAVVRIEDYGAFVEYLPGRDGLVHVSNMSTDFVKDPHSLVSIGDKVKVRVIEIKEDGKIALSMLSPAQEQEQQQQAKSGRSPRNRGSSRNNYGRGSRGARDNRRRSRGRSGSRLSSRGDKTSQSRQGKKSRFKSYLMDK